MMNWDSLTEEQLERLAECRSRKSDIVPIARAYMLNRDYDAETALVTTLEHLDSNSQFFDLTNDEFDSMIRKLERMQND